MVSRPCRRRRPSSLDDGGISGLFSSGGPSVRFLTRYDGEVLQCMKVKSESEVSQSCPSLSDPMDCSLPGSSVHGIFQARVVEWGAIREPKLSFISSVVEAHSIRSRFQQGWFHSEISSLSCRGPSSPSVFSWSFLWSFLIVSSYKDTSHAASGPTYETPFTLVTF